MSKRTSTTAAAAALAANDPAPAPTPPAETAPAPGFYDRVDEFGPCDEEELFPMIQWNHDEGAFEISLKNLPPSVVLAEPVFTRKEIVHTGGTEEVYLAKQLHVAVIAMRERLEQRLDKTTIVLPPGVGKVGEDKVYTRKHLLVLCREFSEAGYPDPVLISIKSTVSADAGVALRALYQFRQAASWAASEKAGRRVVLPRWAFYCPLQAGKTYRSEQGGKVTPLVHGLPEKPTAADFTTAMIPPAAREFIQAYQERAKGWERDPRFFAGGQVLENGNGTVEQIRPQIEPAEEEPTGPAQGGSRRSSQPAARGSDGVPPDYLQMAVPFGTTQHPEFRGQPLGSLLADPDGRVFIDYLATRHKPANHGQEQLVHAARALVSAGLTKAA